MLLTLLIILGVSTFGSNQQTVTPPDLGRDSTPKRTRSNVNAKTPLQSVEPNPARQRLKTRVIDVLTSVADDAQQWDDAAAATRVQARVADLLWPAQPELGRRYLIAAWQRSGAIKEDRLEGSEFRYESPQTLERREIIHVALRRSSELAEKWVAEMSEQDESRSKSQSKRVFDDRTQRSNALLHLAAQSVEKDPQAALRLASESFKDGISFGLQTVLTRLQQRDFGLAQELFNGALSHLRTSGLRDPAELLVLYAYLYTPGRVMAPDIGGDPNNMVLVIDASQPHLRPAAELNPMLAQRFLLMASDLLLGAPLPSMSNSPRNSALAELNTIRILLELMDSQLPAQAAYLRQRMQRVASDLGQAASDSSYTPTPRGEEEREKEDTDDFTQSLVERAKRGTDPKNRDAAYLKAALGMRVESHERAWEIAGSLEDALVREDVRNWIVYRASIYYAGLANFEMSRKLAFQNSDPVQRAACFVVGAQELIKAKNTQDARDWLIDAAAWIGKEKRDEDSVRVALGLVTAYGQFDRIMALNSLSDAVKFMNQTTIDLRREERAPLIKIKTLSSRSVPEINYGTTGFGLRTAAAVFSTGDQFEDVLSTLKNIRFREGRGIAIIALCDAIIANNYSSNTRTR